jgi:hypothetical protein
LRVTGLSRADFASVEDGIRQELCREDAPIERLIADLYSLDK